mgnify:FL=1
MTNHGIMEEANYCQLMTELAYVCELSCESYISQIYMEDVTADVILESGEKILDTLTTFVRKSLQAAVDHISDMITKIRIKFSKKKLEQLMSPEIKKTLEKVCAGEKIISPDIPKMVSEMKKYEVVIKKLNDEVSDMFMKASTSSIEIQKKYCKEVEQVCEKYSKELKEINATIVSLNNKKRPLKVSDVYRFTDAGIKSLEDAEKVMKYISIMQVSMVRMLENIKKTSVKRMKKMITEAGDELEKTDLTTKEKIKVATQKVTDSPAVRSAVNKAVATAREASSYTARAEQYFVGTIESYYKFSLEGDVSKALASNFVKAGLSGHVAATLPMTAGSIAMKAYTKKKLSEDKARLKEKADEAQRQRDLRKLNLRGDSGQVKKRSVELR